MKSVLISQLKQEGWLMDSDPGKGTTVHITCNPESAHPLNGKADNFVTINA